MPTEKVQSERVDNRCQWCIQRLWEQKLAITLVNTKVNCNIASIYGNGATKMSQISSKSCQLQNINTKVVKVDCD